MTVVANRRRQGLTRDQHFIPRMHLAGFLPDEGGRFLQRFDKTTGQVVPVTVPRAAVIKDYNSLPAETGQAPDALERQFAVLETIVAPMLRWLRNARASQPLDLVVRDALAGYFAMLHMRSPVFRERARRLDTFLASVDADLTAASPAAYLSRLRAHGDMRPAEEIEAERPAELERFRSGELYLEAQQASSLKHLGLAVGEFRPRLIDMHWTLYRLERPPFFVLGDQSVVMLGPAGELGEVGFATPDIDILVPLSASALLVITDEPHIGGLDVLMQSEDGRPGLGPSIWQLANEASWRTAERFVHARTARDLQATEFALAPEQRRVPLPGPRFRVHGGLPAWQAYAERLGIEIVEMPDDGAHGAGDAAAANLHSYRALAP